MTESQLARLAKPFPARLIHSNPSGGGSYVKHSVVTEKLLAVCGPFDFELVQVIRGRCEPVGKRKTEGVPALEDAVVGTVCRLSVVVDERRVSVEEVGDCEQPHNWPHDGARLKDAMSDALKRCAMRLGVTLHLWSGDAFSLYEQLRARDESGVSAVTETGDSGVEQSKSDVEDAAGTPVLRARGSSPQSTAATVAT